MKRRFYALLPLLFGLLSPTVAWAEDSITINVSNFPDKIFRDFLTAQPYGGDGVLTEDEIAGVTDMNLPNMGIRSLKGIEHFANLSILVCDSNQLASLDVSKNTSLRILNCSYNRLGRLDLSQNAGLYWLECENNQLTKLDVTQNARLDMLFCGNNQLSKLDVSNNTALSCFYCRNNKLQTLDVTKNSALYSLGCGENLLTSLDVSQNKDLFFLDCRGNKLTNLDVSNNTKLQTLYCDVNQLTSLDVSQNTALWDFYCSNNQLTNLDVSNNTKLQYLYCYNNQLTSLDMSQNDALELLDCVNNQLTSLDVSNCKQLKDIACYGNKLNGQAMDALIASLPVVDAARIYVKRYYQDDNECLSAQIAAVKAKGWIPYYWGIINSKLSQWMEMDVYETSKKTIYTQTIDDVTYTLSHEMTDKYTINANPDSMGWFYKSKLMLDVEKGRETQSYLLDDPIFIGEEMIPANVPSMLFDMDARKLYVFCVSKDGNYDYGMDGFIYECSLDDLSFTKNFIFSRANWGWYSGFMGLRNGRPVLAHWSFAGYIAMVSTCSASGLWTSTQERVLPSIDEYIPIWQQQQHVLVVGNDYGWVTEDQYQAALTAIPTRSTFRIYTMFNSKKYYLTATGTLTESVDDSKEFVFTRVTSNAVYASPGWKMDVPFTNPSLTRGVSGEIENLGFLRTDALKRNDWGGQVWYKKDDCYAVRSTNALSVTCGANSFWSVMDTDSDGQPEAGYSWEPDFVWQLEDISDEDGIESHIAETSDDNTIYNLAGQRQTTLQKGVNIVGGKKIMVR